MHRLSLVEQVIHCLRRYSKNSNYPSDFSHAGNIYASRFGISFALKKHHNPGRQASDLKDIIKRDILRFAQAFLLIKRCFIFSLLHTPLIPHFLITHCVKQDS